LALAINRHKARLTAELTKCRIKRGCSSITELREQVEEAAKQTNDDDDQNSSSATHQHPRWVRVNGIKATLEAALSGYFSDYTQTDKLSDLFSSRSKHIYIDPHIPNLLALPPSTELTKHAAYLSGALILQDKASCFPAYLINPNHEDKHIIDACAAPGNKTTHLAGILHPLQTKDISSEFRITACERNRQRAETLQKMVKLAGGDSMINVRASQDFLLLDPKDKNFQDVTALLLDPSCSGSGIVGRDANAASLSVVLTLPSLPSATANPPSKTSLIKKRKRQEAETSASRPERPEKQPKIATDTTEENPLSAPADPSISAAEAEEALQKRLTNLSLFQLKLLKHAMAFPAATRITYSTCSVHATENESVVLRALCSEVAKRQGWKVMKRSNQVDGMRKWARRGDLQSTKDLLEGMRERGDVDDIEVDAEEVAEACIRCAKGTEEGTMGFFVCGFVRDGQVSGKDPEEQARETTKKQKKIKSGVNGAASANTASKSAARNTRSETNDGGDDWEGFSD